MNKKIILIFTLMILAVSLNCGWSRQLDRARAADLISRSPQFTEPFTVIIRHQKDSRQLDPISPSETKEQGQARAVEEYFNASPYRGALRELGLVTASATYVKTTMYGEREGPSLYNLDVRLTEKGEQLWRDLKMPVDPAALPLARREIVEVTGIAGGDEKAKRATAEFNWKWTPTLAGRAMMRGTPEFSNLPDRIKQQFDEKGLTLFDIGAHRPLELNGIQHSLANFQLYDDGWRLERLPFDNRPLNPLN